MAITERQLNNVISLDSSTTIFGNNSSQFGKIPASLFFGVHNMLHVQEQQASGTNGGIFEGGAWRTRTLNTVLLNHIDSAVLNNNQISLPAGTYYIDAILPAKYVNSHKGRLYNVGVSTALILGTDMYNTVSTSGTVTVASPAANTVSTSRVSGLFTLTITSTLEIQHICLGWTGSSTDATGFGASASQGTSIYTDAKIWKLL